jgi:CRISPR-associated protein Csh2
MTQSYTRRAYGCAVIKSVNSNYNADFTHQPRTLPDGTVYATDKVLKYSVKNYFTRNYKEDKIFYFKTFNDTMQPRTLDETYNNLFGPYPQDKGKNKDSVVRLAILKNLLQCLDIRLFGATFAGETNLSIHGPVQITHGLNRYAEGAIFSEQIMSPFRNPGDNSKDSTMSTLGTQVRLREGHYVHHFSVNPQNLDDHVRRAGDDATGLTDQDIEKLKEALRSGVTFYDSASKAGTENELLLWVELKEGSKLVLPSLVELVSVGLDRVVDLSKVQQLLDEPRVQEQIDRIELYYHAAGTQVRNAPAAAQHLAL